MNSHVPVMQQIENNFTYHEPREGQARRYSGIRAEAKKLAQFIASVTPESREQTNAITHLEQSVFWANAAIARNEQSIPTSVDTSV